MKRFSFTYRILPVFGIALLLLLGACKKNEEVEELSLSGTLASTSDLSTLHAAFLKAKIIGIFDIYHPMTLFAPSNAAFETLFEELGVNGIQDLSAEFLDSLLYYHILFGELNSSLFANGYIGTLLGGPDLEPVVMQINDVESTVNKEAHITEVDLRSSNGVIHRIDRVLIPPTVLEIADQNGQFTHFLEAVEKAGLDSLLKQSTPHTLFVPNDEAFEAFFTDQKISGIGELSKEEASLLIRGHIAEGNLVSVHMTSGYVSTLNGDILLDINSVPKINFTSNLLSVDLQGTNGVIHIISRVLIPTR